MLHADNQLSHHHDHWQGFKSDRFLHEKEGVSYDAQLVLRMPKDKTQSEI